MPRTKVGEKKAEKPKSKFSVSIVGLDGKADGELSLPEALFGQKVNDRLIAQAVRVYLNNQKGHHSNTKTRGEVQGSTRKIKAQKEMGTRHGSIRAPIFVGGGVALGPEARKISLDLPKKMKKAALVSALSDKLRDNEVLGLGSLDKLTGKTSQVANLLQALSKKSVLMLSDKNEKLAKASRNLRSVLVLPASQVNVFDLVRYQTLLLTKGAVEELQVRIKGQEAGIEASKEEKIVSPPSLKLRRMKKEKV